MSGMALWKVRIHKERGEAKWSNVYTVQASSLPAAVSAGQLIYPRERAITSDDILFTVMEVEPAVLGAGGGTVVTLGQYGTNVMGGGEALLFVTVRCFFRPSAGKPSQKYLRGVLYKDSYNSSTGAITPAVVTGFQTNYVNPLMAIPEFVDVDGQPFTSAGVVPHVQERQMKRKRRSRAGFKRGWVPA